MTILKIDIDKKPFNRTAFNKKILALASELNETFVVVQLDATKRGTHAKIKFETELSNELIVACQLYLGSDPARELFNIGRLHRGEKEGWNVLFKCKWKQGKKISQETKPRIYNLILDNTKGGK